MDTEKHERNVSVEEVEALWRGVRMKRDKN